MEIQYSLTEEDILDLMLNRLQQLPLHKNPIWINRAIYLAAIMLLGVGTFIMSSNSPLPLTFLLLAGILFFVYPHFFRWNLKKKVFTTYRDEKMRASLTTRSLFVTDEHLLEKSPLGEARINWDTVTGVEATEDRIFISLQKVPMVIIPRERVSLGNFEEFAAECRDRIRVTAV